MTASTGSAQAGHGAPASSRRVVVLALVTSWGVVVAFGFGVLTLPVVAVVVVLVGVIGALSVHDARPEPRAYLRPLPVSDRSVRIHAPRAGDAVRVGHSDAA